MKSLSLNWLAYYKAFCSAHGGNPVEYKGRQLFADGWMYAIKDHAGPEWSPPVAQAELVYLQRAYWTIRIRALRQRTRFLRQAYDHLKRLQDQKNIPLQVTVTYKNEDGKTVRELGDVNFGMLEIEMNIVNDELLDSLKELQAITDTSLLAPTNHTHESNGHARSNTG